MCIGKNTCQDSFILEDLCLTNNKKEGILGVPSDSKHNFNNDMKKYVEKLDRK